MGESASNVEDPALAATLLLIWLPIATALSKIVVGGTVAQSVIGR
jgi:hypothetical protein